MNGNNYLDGWDKWLEEKERNVDRLIERVENLENGEPLRITKSEYCNFFNDFDAVARKSTGSGNLSIAANSIMRMSPADIDDSENYMVYGVYVEFVDRQSLAGQWGEFADEFAEFWAMLSEPILDMVSGWLVRLRGWWQG